MISVFFIRLISLFPLRLLYIISDLLRIIVQYLFRYRVKVVDKNLNLASKNLSFKNLSSIKKDFYKYFIDLYLEVIKMDNLSEKFFLKNFEVQNIDLLNKYYDDGKSVILMLSHYSGYEWCVSLPYFIKHHLVGVYSPISNKRVDEFIQKSRSKHGMSLISRYSAYRDILKIEKEESPTLYGLVADQSPQLSSKNLFWTKFLGQEVPVFTGSENIAKKFNLPVVYGEMSKLKRGKYKIEFKLISENPQKEKEYDITKKYLKLVEKQINNDPSLYLWTHNRFKHTKN